MLRLASLVLLVVLSGLLGGCALSEDDKAFYYRGWLRPTDLDHDAPNRLGPKHQAPAGFKRDPLVD